MAVGTPIFSPKGETIKTIAPAEPVKPAQIQLGTGISMWNGTIQEEYLPDLRPWKKAYEVYREMMDDAVIGTMMESIKLPLLDAKFEIVPAGDQSVDEDAAEFLQKQTLDNPRISWNEHIQEALSFIPFGWFLAEKVLVKNKGFYELGDLIPIAHNTLYKWAPPDISGKVTGFIQQIPDGNYFGQNTKYAPIHKLLHFTFQSSKRNPMGKALMRSLYRPWYFAKNLQVVEAIGAERDVGNVPVFKLLEGGYYDKNDVARLIDQAKGLRLDDTTHMILPPGVDAVPFGSGGKVYDTRTMIRDYQHLIRQRFFMDFVAMGSESVGTEALAREVTGFFSLALGAIQKSMLEVWQKQLASYLFYWNAQKFPGLEEVPKIKWSKPGKLNIQSVAQSVSTLVGSSIITNTPSLETHLREQFELPPISDAEREEIQAEKEAKQMEMFGGGQFPPNADNKAMAANKGAGKNPNIKPMMSDKLETKPKKRPMPMEGKPKASIGK